MKILIDDNDFLIVNRINDLKKLVNEKPFEDLYNNDNHFLTNVYNFDGDLFDFDYFRLSGTIKRDIKTGYGILSNNFDFHDNNGNVLFSFNVIDWGVKND